MIIGPSQGRVFWLPFSIFIHYLLLISNPQGGQSRRKSTLARLTRPIVSVLSTSSAPRWLRFKKAGKGLNFPKYLWIESETQGNVKVHLWPSFDFQLLCLKVRDRLLNAHNSLGSVGRSTNIVFAFWESKYWLHIHFWIPRFSKLTTSSSLGSSPKKPMWHTGLHKFVLLSRWYLFLKNWTWKNNVWRALFLSLVKPLLYGGGKNNDDGCIWLNTSLLCTWFQAVIKSVSQWLMSYNQSGCIWLNMNTSPLCTFSFSFSGSWVI